MFGNKNINILGLFLLNFHWNAAFSYQPIQQPQFVNANQNFYVPQAQPYANYAAVVSPNQPQLLYQYSTPNSHSQLWSSAPIVVADDTQNIEQNSSENQYDLQSRTRNSKALSRSDNNNNNGHRGEQQQQQQVPSNYNYANPGVYHSSDVWRHQQLQQQQQHQHYPTVLTNFHSNEQQNSLNHIRQQQQQPQQFQNNETPSPPTYQQQQSHHLHNQQQQQQHLQPVQQQLFASNTDLNYLQATPINHRSYSSINRNAATGEVRGKTKTQAEGRVIDSMAADYSQHFKEYLRKHPSRIEPIY